MAFEFKFPDIGEGLTEGEIVRWLVKVGDEIKEGQPLVEVETDKALAEIPSPRTGTILKILAKEKEIVKVGQVIVVIGEKGEALAAPPPGPSAPAPKPKSVGVVGELEEAPEEAPAVAAKAEPIKPAPAKPALVSEHALATPAVRALAFPTACPDVCCFALWSPWRASKRWPRRAGLRSPRKVISRRFLPAPDACRKRSTSRVTATTERTW